MAHTARREAHRFIGQVVEHLLPGALTVWSLDEGCAYRAFSVALADFPVGKVVECTMFDRDAFIDNLHAASDETIAEYRRRLVAPLPR
jgi:hypothetical protein